MAPSRLNYLADFDSAAAMLRALAHFLQHRAFPDLGLTSALRPVAVGANLLPLPLRQEVYKIGGYFEAVAPETLVRVKDEDIDRWVVEQYPARRYPAVLVGSSNGALTHLAAALGAPWLPQIFLIPVRQRGIQVDEPKHALELGGEPGRRLLDANPDLQLHHMHDANQDRLMTHYMTYFRIKRRRLGEAYARFLAERLQPGGIIILVECRHSWPTTRVGPRHVFQHGGAEGSARKSTSRVFPAWRAGSPSAPALGVASARRREPRGQVGLRAGVARGTWSATRTHMDIASCASCSTSPRSKSAGDRSLSMVVPGARPPGEPPAGRLFHPDGSVVEAAARCGPVLDEVQHRGLGAALEPISTRSSRMTRST